MFVLYQDDSGSVKNRNERHFVLAGIAVYERQFSYITDEIFEKIEFDQKSRAP